VENLQLKKRKYKRAEVLAMLDAYKSEYETRLAEQRANIQEIAKERDMILAELDALKEKESLIISTLIRAEQTAMELKEQAEVEYALEVERLKRFSEKWDAYFKKVKDKYPTSTAVKKAVGVKDKLDKAIKTKKAKEVVQNMDLLLDGGKKAKFNPKSKIRDYIAATSDNGFNLDEVLNPGELQLEDLCKELGLIGENE